MRMGGAELQTVQPGCLPRHCPARSPGPCDSHSRFLWSVGTLRSNSGPKVTLNNKAAGEPSGFSPRAGVPPLAERRVVPMYSRLLPAPGIQSSEILESFPADF